MIRGDSSQEPHDWLAPVDALAPPHVRLAVAIAQRIGRLIQSGRSAGDILVLLRRRSCMADAINRALKQAGIAVAGADRLVLGEHIAVEDLMVLMQAVLLPEDDLSLAALLRSPLIGLSQEHLEALAVDREGLLIDALNAPTDIPAIGMASRRLAGWRAMADQASPFGFLSTVLGADGGRRAMIARLGEDCRDPLDEVLALAREEETRPGSCLASLEGFLDTLRRIQLTIKRDMEARADKVRIMTVHGSKGLEAPVVFLVDTCSLPQAPKGMIAVEQDSDAEPGNRAMPPLLQMGADMRAPAYALHKQARAERNMEEYRRLLYVAMTRAADHLIVTGHVGKSDPGPECWYNLIDSAVGADARQVEDQLDGVTDAGPVRLWKAGPWPDSDPDSGSDSGPEPQAEGADAAAKAAREEQDCREAELQKLLATPTPRPASPAPLRPSRARRDAALAGEDWPSALDAERHAATMARLLPGGARASTALLLGSLVHRLLEPSTTIAMAQPTQMAQARQMLLALEPTLQGEPVMMQGLVEQALAQAQAVRAMAQAGEIFGPHARAEVPLRGTLHDGAGAPRAVSGSIDKLVLGEHEVWAIDFKTNASVPHLKDGVSDALSASVPDYIAQMALYEVLLGQVFPGRQVRCALLWTQEPRLDWLAPEALAAARRAMVIGGMGIQSVDGKAASAP